MVNPIESLNCLFTFFTFFISGDAMDWAFVHKTWDKWASTNIGYSGQQDFAFKPHSYEFG